MTKRIFSNPHLENSRRSIWDIILWKLGFYNDPVFRIPPPADFMYPIPQTPVDPSLPWACWIGHSTFLIEVDGITLLTDPVWDSYCSPIPLPAFKRRTDPPFSLADLPKIDLILISHNHYDHLDVKTVAELHAFHPQIEWIVPTGLADWFRKRGVTRIRELHWWETNREGHFTVTAVPAQHFSGRTPWDQNQTLWNGYVLETKSKRLYFIGDTGYNPIDFKAIGAQWPYMDLSLIPIGAYAPRRLMKPVHVSPCESVQIHQDVNSRLSLGMHWKTFALSDEPIDQPPYDLYLAMQEKQIPLERFLAIEPGTYINW